MHAEALGTSTGGELHARTDRTALCCRETSNQMGPSMRSEDPPPRQIGLRGGQVQGDTPTRCWERDEMGRKLQEMEMKVGRSRLGRS